MKSLLQLFTVIDTPEDCPVGVTLLVWDGCDFQTDYVDTDVEYGTYYFANGSSGVAYLELPDHQTALRFLGEGV